MQRRVWSYLFRSEGLYKLLSYCLLLFFQYVDWFKIDAVFRMEPSIKFTGGGMVFVGLFWFW